MLISKYSVYKHTSPSGKVYIGITSNTPNKRWKYGYGYIAQKLFYRAILKYGWNNIKHEILFTGLTKEQAETAEVIVSEKTKELLRKSMTGKKATLETRAKMSEAQKQRFKLSPKIVSDKAKEKMSKSRRGKFSAIKGRFAYENKTSKSVLQYSKDGVFIAEYGSMLDAKRKLGVCSADISKCYNGKRKSAGGYLWRFANGNKNEWVS